MNKLTLEIVAPDRLVLSEAVDSLVVSASEGMLGILPGHAPLMVELKIGPLTFRRAGEAEKVAVMGGVLRCKDNRVLVITTAAERAKEIDAFRAERDKEKAEMLIAEKSGEKEVLKAHTLLTKSLTRLKVAGKSK